MQRFKMQGQSLTFGECCELYIQDCKSRNLRAATIKHYKSSYKQMFNYFSVDMPINEFTVNNYNQYVIYLKSNLNNDMSINAYLRDLITMLHFLMNNGYMQEFKMRAIKTDKPAKETYTDEALEILKDKKKGNYNVIQIDPDYVPAPIEHKQVFGVTFEQGRNELKIDEEFFSNIVTENKELTEQAKIDLAISMITLKYTQSNSVCFVKDGQAIGIGAGQQSRIHCTRLAGGKADNWWLRQSPQVMNLPFVDGIRRADRDNAIDLYIGEDYMDVLADDAWPAIFKEKPEVFTREAKREWLDKLSDVALGSDAFFPFGDNIERAHKSGVKYIAQPGGSVRDDNVIATCNKYGMVMSFTGIRLFHH